jgi:MSHA pilin protein MshD
MPETETRVRQIIPEKTMLDRLAQSEQMREFFIQMWRQNPVLAKQAGAKVQNLMTQLDRGDAKPLVCSAGKNQSSVLNPQSSERGISLIELIMYIVIVSVALAGIMMVLNANSTFSADPFVKKQARAAAESLLEEIELHDFLPSGWTGAAIQANRSNFNDVMDYNGFATSGVYPANGAVAIPGLGDYNVSVAVAGVGFGNITSASAVQITVTVNNLNASEAVEAIGYRVDY